MRQIVFLVFSLEFKFFTTGAVRNSKDMYSEQVYTYTGYSRKNSVVQLDFKTPNLGFLPYDKNNYEVIWSVYHLYIFYKRLAHIHHHGR